MPAAQPYGKRITEEVRRYCGTYTHIPGGGAGDGRAGWITTGLGAEYAQAER